MNLLRSSMLTLAAAAMLQVAPTLAADVVQGFGLLNLADSLSDVGTAEAAFIRRGKIKKRATHGYKVVVVVGDDGTNNEVNTIDVVLTPEGGDGSEEPILLTLEYASSSRNGNKRFVFNLLELDDDAAYASYNMTSTMRDADNNPIGAAFTDVLEVEPDGDPRVRKANIRFLNDQTDEASFVAEARVVVVADSEGEVDSLEFTLIEPLGLNKYYKYMTNFYSASGKRTFTDVTLSFPPELAGSSFELTVEMLDVNGQSLGTYEQTVVLRASRQAQIEALEAELEASLGREGVLAAAVDEMSALALDLEETYLADPGTPIADLMGTIDAINAVSIALEFEEEGTDAAVDAAAVSATATPGG